jgi:hypothetical protein
VPEIGHPEVFELLPVSRLGKRTANPNAHVNSDFTVPFSSYWWEFKTIRWALSVGTYSWRRVASGSMLDARLAGT